MSVQIAIPCKDWYKWSLLLNLFIFLLLLLVTRIAVYWCFWSLIEWQKADDKKAARFFRFFFFLMQHFIFSLYFKFRMQRKRWYNLFIHPFFNHVVRRKDLYFGIDHTQNNNKLSTILFRLVYLLVLQLSSLPKERFQKCTTIYNLASTAQYGKVEILIVLFESFCLLYM